MLLRVVACVVILILPQLVSLFLRIGGYPVEMSQFVWFMALPLILAIIWWPRPPREAEERVVVEE